MAISFAKLLICTSHHENLEQCSLCNICHQIDAGTYANFKLIEPDGLWIKKEQLLDLQVSYNTKSIDNNYRVYIINGADKLNKFAANAMLKFLEEPDDDIIAILLAPSRHQVLKTIISRCQIYSLVPSQTDLDISPDIRSAVVSFCYMIETKGPKTIAFQSQIWDNILNSKENMALVLEWLAHFYEEVLNYKLHLNFIEKVSNKNNIEEILNKLSYLYSLPKKMKYNVNQNLLLDQIVIKLSEVFESESSRC